MSSLLLWDLPEDSIAPLSLMAGSYMAITAPVEVLHMICLVSGCHSTRATLAFGATFISARDMDRAGAGAGAERGITVNKSDGA